MQAKGEHSRAVLGFRITCTKTQEPVGTVTSLRAQWEQDQFLDSVAVHRTQFSVVCQSLLYIVLLRQILIL